MYECQRCLYSWEKKDVYQCTSCSSQCCRECIRAALDMTGRDKCVFCERVFTRAEILRLCGEHFFVERYVGERRASELYEEELAAMGADSSYHTGLLWPLTSKTDRTRTHLPRDMPASLFGEEDARTMNSIRSFLSSLLTWMRVNENADVGNNSALREQYAKDLLLMHQFKYDLIKREHDGLRCAAIHSTLFDLHCVVATHLRSVIHRANEPIDVTDEEEATDCTKKKKNDDLHRIVMNVRFSTVQKLLDAANEELDKSYATYGGNVPRLRIENDGLIIEPRDADGAMQLQAAIDLVNKRHEEGCERVEKQRYYDRLTPDTAGGDERRCVMID
jgi:hypothetical protein